MANWFYRMMGDEFGPLTTQQLIDAVIENTISSDTEVRKDPESFWTFAMDVKGLFAAVDKKRAEYEGESERLEAQRKQAEIDSEDKKRRRWENLKISTCGPLPGKEFRVIDTIFAMDSSSEKEGFFSHTEANPDDAFTKVKEQLRRYAFELGADAVVSCQFEYRVAVSTDKGVEALANWVGVSGGHSQCVEIFAYGTAVSYE